MALGYLALVEKNTSEGRLTHRTEMTTPITVRSWPLSVCDQVILEKAGLDGVDSRWAMRCHSPVTVSSGDIITVENIHYEILAFSASRDEDGVEWILLTRRRES